MAGAPNARMEWRRARVQRMRAGGGAPGPGSQAAGPGYLRPVAALRASASRLAIGIARGEEPPHLTRSQALKSSACLFLNPEMARSPKSWTGFLFNRWALVILANKRVVQVGLPAPMSSHVPNPSSRASQSLLTSGRLASGSTPGWGALFDSTLEALHSNRKSTL